MPFNGRLRQPAAVYLVLAYMSRLGPYGISKETRPPDDGGGDSLPFMIYPPKPNPGDRVAVLSLGAGLPALFPEVYELGLGRLRREIGLEPVEFPTTRVDAPPAARARDLHDALTDPSIAAIMATIGGDDQITVLKHLNAEVIRAHPKPFYGY